MSGVPYQLYRAADVKELDRIAIEAFSIPGIELMNRAGKATFAALRERWPDAKRIAVVCGGGNNGGDGFVIARLARQAGLDVSLVLLVDPASLKGDAMLAYEATLAADVISQTLKPELFENVDLIVDALLGIGLDREVEGAWRDAIESINAAAVPVVAVDIPSGLNADCGTVMGVAVEVAMTMTFIGVKQGLLTAQGPDHCGELLFDDLGVPPEIYQKVKLAAERIDETLAKTLLQRRARSTHKGDYGRVLVVGGASGMSGAVRMAGEAALRCGAGLVSIATCPEHAAVLNLPRPELMVHGVAGGTGLRPLIKQADAVAIGPGLGQSEWGRTMLTTVLDAGGPLVIDADALNLLALEPQMRDDWVLTPHPGEAARLLGVSTSEIEVDRFTAIDRLQAQYGGVAVLKGCGSLVVDQEGAVSLCSAGNPGMASGGMGDLLTGVIAALIAQGLSLADAARLGVALHAAAGDRAAVRGERGMVASDLLPHLRTLVNSA